MIRGLIPLALCASAWGQTPDAAAVDSCDYALVTLQGATYVELEVGTARGLFLFDTGANVSGIDGGWLAKTGIRGTFEDGGSMAGTTGVQKVEKVVLPGSRWAAGSSRRRGSWSRTTGTFAIPTKAGRWGSWGPTS
ncbi:MAG: hypothetical protein R3F62_28225 [Planctomycetota bacterium]